MKGFTNEYSSTQGVKVSSQVCAEFQHHTSALNQLWWRFDPPDLGVITGCCLKGISVWEEQGGALTFSQHKKGATTVSPSGPYDNRSLSHVSLHQMSCWHFFFSLCLSVARCESTLHPFTSQCISNETGEVENHAAVFLFLMISTGLFSSFQFAVTGCFMLFLEYSEFFFIIIFLQDYSSVFKAGFWEQRLVANCVSCIGGFCQHTSDLWPS